MTDDDGFVSLFNGRDLSGWKVPAGDNGHWKVVDGVIDYDAVYPTGHPRAGYEAGALPEIALFDAGARGAITAPGATVLCSIRRTIPRARRVRACRSSIFLFSPAPTDLRYPCTNPRYPRDKLTLQKN